MLTSSVPQPLAEGSLGATPFAHVLLSIQKKGLSGTLAVWPDDDRPGQDRILFRAGVPAMGRFLEPAADLERGLLAIFHRRQAPYAFYEADLVGSAEGALRGQVDVFALLATALRGEVPRDAMARVIRKLGLERQRIKTGAPLARFGFLSNETAFIELARAEPATAPILIEQFGDPKVAQRMIYLLAITDCLEPYRAVSQQKLKAVSSSQNRRRISSPPPAKSPSGPGSMPPPRGRASTPPGSSTFWFSRSTVISAEGASSTRSVRLRWMDGSTTTGRIPFFNALERKISANDVLMTARIPPAR